jgi:hypothetical protein
MTVIKCIDKSPMILCLGSGTKPDEILTDSETVVNIAPLLALTVTDSLTYMISTARLQRNW